MAVPKRKMSRSNTRHRRSQWKAVAPSLVTCANPACGAKHLPHRACPECGVRLIDEPDHTHEAAIDPRWAALTELKQDPTD